LSWTGTGTAYDGARATDARFTNATTQFSGTAVTNHTYAGGLTNARTLEFFDVTDETEGNRGGDWNAGVLPPLPPAIDTEDPSTNIDELFIGSTGIIAGAGFSNIPETNTICFEGGVCTQATSTSANQLQFITPPGAYSGAVTVTVGGQTSDPATAIVALDDPSEWSGIVRFTYSKQDRSYWVRGTASGVNSLYRLYYDTTTQRWARDDRGLGGFLFSSYSSQSSVTGRIFGLGSVDHSEGIIHVAVVDTNPPSSPTFCLTIDLNLFNSPDISGATFAVDPNPDNARTDAAYVTVSETRLGAGSKYRIVKIAHDCSAILDDNYGNFGTDLGPRNHGMVVDPSNGDLYFVNDGDILRIATNEIVSTVRTGLPATTGIEALTREGANDPGTLLLITDGVVEALALDNVGANPVQVATATGISSDGGFGAQVSGGPWVAANVNRTVTVYRDGTSLVLEDHPLLDVTLRGPATVRISSPKTGEEEQLPVGQSEVRESQSMNVDYSHAIVELQYRDGHARNTCAKVGDPGPGAPQYDPTPTAPTNCHKPRDDAAGVCDNIDDIAVDGPFSFVGGSGFTSCKTCGGATPCTFEFRVTNRYAGDNYEVYFSGDDTAQTFAATSGIYSAWKHIHVELERMFRQGGLLSQSFDPATCGNACNEITVWDWANIDSGTVTVVVLDANTTGEERTVMSRQSNPDGTITLVLDAPLTQEYIASPYPDFDSGLSAGIGQIRDSSGVPCGTCFFEPDLSGLPQAFDDGLTSYHVADYGLDGSGAIPFVPELNVSTDAGRIANYRFHQVWFAHKMPMQCSVGATLCSDCCNVSQNYFHALGLRTSESANLGLTAALSDMSVTWVQACETVCTPSCTADELARFIRRNGAHEFGHQFNVNDVALGGHDGNTAWCGTCGDSGSEKCVMNVDDQLADRIDGIDRFDCFNLIQNEGFCQDMTETGEGIRTASDPQ
jgi:hypothetical protein